MRALLITAVLVGLTACSTNPTAKGVLDAIKIRDDQCGTATITGNVEIGGTLGFFGSTVVVNIDKSKLTYKDAAGNVVDCP